MQIHPDKKIDLPGTSFSHLFSVYSFEALGMALKGFVPDEPALCQQITSGYLHISLERPFLPIHGK